MVGEQFRNEVLNPCPTCGERFDFNGCMTFVDIILEKFSDGKCPKCRTQVVYSVPVEQLTHSASINWDGASSIDEIRELLIVDVELSVRSRYAVSQLGFSKFGDLLDSTEAFIRQNSSHAETLIEELRPLLARKNLTLRPA